MYYYIIHGKPFRLKRARIALHRTLAIWQKDNLPSTILYYGKDSFSDSFVWFKITSIVITFHARSYFRNSKESVPLLDNIEEPMSRLNDKYNLNTYYRPGESNNNWYHVLYHFFKKISSLDWFRSKCIKKFNEDRFLEWKIKDKKIRVEK